MAERPFNPNEIRGALERELMDDFGETALAILRNVITGSPVGNPDGWRSTDFGRLSGPIGYVGGHFKRNWQVSIGGFRDTEIEGIDATGGPTIAAGRATIQGFKKRKPGARLVIQNNVPYANRLAMGHSRQRKAGWVDREIDAALTLPGGSKVLA